MHSQSAVLVACSDQDKLDYLCHQLCADGHAADVARSAAEAAVKARSSSPQVLVLGALGTPLAQLELLRAIRAGEAHGARFNPSVAVIVIGTAGGELELVRCFEAGCDDYLAPPGCYHELRARLGGLLRRLDPRGAASKRIGALAIDPHTATASYAGRRLALTRTELAVLNHLAADPTRVASKRELLREVWGYRAEGRTRTVDSHCCRLRRKLTDAGARGLVVNVWGVGYRLHDVPAPKAATASGPHLAAA